MWIEITLTYSPRRLAGWSRLARALWIEICVPELPAWLSGVEARESLVD